MQISIREIKLINSLKLKKFRLLHQLFIAETPKLVEELISSEYEIYKIYATSEWIEPNNVNLPEVIELNNRQLKKISSLKTPNKVLALIKIPEHHSNNTFKGCTLVLDGIQNPGNLGTIIRSADWFGIHQIICSEDTAEVFSPKVVQASMGSLTRVKLYYKNLTYYFKNKKDHHPVLGTDTQGENLFNTEFPKEFYLVIGSEGKGISKEMKPFILKNISIPRYHKASQSAESLNAAVATSIILSYIK